MDGAFRCVFGFDREADLAGSTRARIDRRDDAFKQVAQHQRQACRIPFYKQGYILLYAQPKLQLLVLCKRGHMLDEA